MVQSHAHDEPAQVKGEPEDSQDRLCAQDTLANALSIFVNDHGTAEQIYRDKHAVELRLHGPQHRRTLTSLCNLALVAERQGKLDAAIATMRTAVFGLEKAHGNGHELAAKARGILGAFLAARGEGGESTALLSTAAAAAKLEHGVDSGTHQALVGDLSRALLAQQNFSVLLPLIMDSLPRCLRVFGAEHRHTANVVLLFRSTCNALIAAGRWAEAETLLRGVYTRQRDVLGLDHADTTATMALLLQVTQKNMRRSLVASMAPAAAALLVVYIVATMALPLMATNVAFYDQLRSMLAAGASVDTSGHLHYSLTDIVAVCYRWLG